MFSYKQRTRTKRMRLSFSLQSLTLVSMLMMSIHGGLAFHESSPSSTMANANAAGEQPLTAAYVFDRKNLNLKARDAENLNQMNFSFALLKDGKVSGAHWQSIEAFQDYIKANPHILPVLSVGGWEADGFSQAASTEQGRKEFVDSALSLMEQYGFLGIDIDWEYPGSSAAGIESSPEDLGNFTLLLEELRSGLDKLTQADGKVRKLCIAVGGDLSLVDNIENEKVGKIVDQVNLMTYDLQSANTVTHHTALYPSNPDYPNSVDTVVQAYAKAGIPLSKMMVGCAQYGRFFSPSSPEDQGLYQPASSPAYKTKVYDKLQAALADGTYTRHYDDVAQAPYLYDGTSFVSYDDPVSISAKGQYVQDTGLMGLMCWEYSGDPSGELLQAMKQSLQK